MKKPKTLTWDELATIYDQRHNGRKARTLPMEDVATWALTQPDIVVDEEDNICLKEKAA